MKKTWILVLFVITALLLLSACDGADNTGATTGSTSSTVSSNTGFVCNKMGPGLIPSPSGKPQLIYFYRDT
ncbi:MAG: hypothetical protein WC828_04390 [Thermoleophilia bacterium]|jgi:hypothetical protein